MAVTLTADQLRDRARIPASFDDDRVAAWLAVASELVNAYARNAPESVANEAVSRCVGWLKNSPPGDLHPTKAGPVELTWRPSVSRNALRLSGAMGLLSPWHRPLGLLLVEDD